MASSPGDDVQAVRKSPAGSALRGRSSGLVLAVVAAAAAYFVLLRLGEHDLQWRLRQWGVIADVTGVDHPSLRRDGRFAAHDVYAGYYQVMAYARRSVENGGRGLFWNPFQNCGQPFLAMIGYGMLSPMQAIPLVFGVDLALWLLPFVHLVVAGLGAYLLCRELGAGRAAAVSGALAFELGNATVETAVWLPTINGSFVWLPAALLFCERALRQAGVANVVGLAIVLALVWLAGFPQVAFFTYQLIALRVGWEIVSGRARGTAVVAVVLGLALAPLAAAVQMVPALEAMRGSSRDAALTPEQMLMGHGMDWQQLRLALGGRVTVHQPLTLLSCMLAAAALVCRVTRARAAFYAAAGALFLVLAMGPSTPVFAWYLELPFAALFRDPARFSWLTSMCLAVLTALGVEAVLSTGPTQARWAPTGALAMTLVLVGFRLLTPGGLRPMEWALGGAAVATALAVLRAPARRAAAGAAICVVILLGLVATPAMTAQFLLATPEPLRTHADVFARLRARMTAQDRVYFSFAHPFVSYFGLTAKSAMFFGVPALVDYEASISRRYADIFMMMKTGASTWAPTAFIWNQAGGTPPGFNRRLLDLAAGRYLLAEKSVDNTTAVLKPALRLLEDDGAVRLYENTEALPRARWVPRVEVIPDSPALLGRLAHGEQDPRDVALVEAPLPSGPGGAVEGTARGATAFVRNEPEHVVVRVEAPAAGFLVLADQYFPGWTATVNGAPRPIVRADYVFRLVEVPAGESLVEFRFAPRTLRLGAWISGITLLGMAGALTVSVAQRRRAPGSIAAEGGA